MAPPGIRMLTGGDLVLPEGHGPLPPQPRALLAALLLNAGAEVSRDWLADLLWPEADQQTARRRLRMTLLNLRNSLEGADWSRIRATRDVLRLDVDPMRIDVFRFERAAASDHPETSAMACDLYAGDLLARFPSISDEFDRFLDDRRAALHSIALSLLFEAMRSARSRGDPTGFEGAFRRLVRIDPVDDAATCLAMEAWAEAGQGERIEEEFRRFRTAYAETYDAQPPETVAAAYRAAVERAVRAPPKQPPRRTEDTAPARAHGEIPARRLNRSRTLPAVLVALACLAGLAWTIRELRPYPNGSVILLSTADLAEEGCTIPEAAARYRQEIRDGLEEIDGASLVVGPVGRALARSGDATFELKQSVTCRGDLLRVTLTLSRPEAAQAVWIGRFDAGVAEIDRLSDRVQTALVPVLSGGAD